MDALPDRTPPEFTSLVDQVALVSSGSIISTVLVEAALARIARVDPELGAFVIALPDRALEETAQRDAAVAAGEVLGALHGVPIAIKDENDVAGVRTTYGGAAATRIAERDAELVRRQRAAGAVIVGKTATPEFGLWPFTESLVHGITRNPWDRMRSPPAAAAAVPTR